MDAQLSAFSAKHTPTLLEILKDATRVYSTEKILTDAMWYSLSAGGKRIRPLLILAILESYQLEITDDAYQVAASVEAIHTYSLIHDDLPAMDNDQLRRGKPTNHVVYGEANAILAGDALINLAFSLIVDAPLADEKKVRLISKLACLSGAEGMVAGQVADINGEHLRLSFDELLFLHQRKTGALLSYCGQAGALLADCHPAEKELWQKLCEHFGLAFQICDDILDVEGTEKSLGKAVHKDNQAQKNTFPARLELSGAKQFLKDELNAAFQCLTDLEVQAKQDGKSFDSRVISAILNTLKEQVTL